MIITETKSRVYTYLEAVLVTWYPWSVVSIYDRIYHTLGSILKQSAITSWSMLVTVVFC